MPSQIGRFEIRRELGRGAQSIVYLAWDPQLQREVAIKTVHLDGSDSGLSSLFLAEARAVSQLQHPHAVPIFEMGEQEGDPFLVFEYVEGRTLADRLRDDGPIESAEAADIMVRVVDALARAHQLGIIHRDLKPSNILMDAQGRPRVMDFGIALRVADVTEAAEAAGGPLVGTPAYMAPEYVAGRRISEQTDVYAAGLILLEMVTARRVRQGETIGQLLYRIAHEDVTLPKGIDERLGGIILKACARDPGLRYARASQMVQALQHYLGGDSTASEAAGEAGKQSTLDFLLRRMRVKTDFPALSESVSAINKLTHSDRESINKLSNTILKDYALTNKILRLVNSAFYRQAGGGNISTVSRAVIVLGFDAVRNIAITLLLFEHLQDKTNAKELKESFLRANLAGLMARDAGKRFMARDVEEAFICSLFHGLGQMLAQFYFPEEMESLRGLMQQKALTPDQAAAQVLGISFEELGIGVATSWGFPGSIVNSMRRLGEGKIHKPATHDETLRVIAGFSNELCDLIAATPVADRDKAVAGLSERYGTSMHFSDRQLKEVVEHSFEDLRQLADILHVNLKQSPFARQVSAFSGTPEAPRPTGEGETLSDGLAATVLMEAPPDVSAEAPDEDGEVSSHDAEAILAAGIQDISNSLVEDFSLNDLLRIILETMYRAIGFKRVMLCLKDARSGEMIGRFGFGPDTSDLAKQFRFPLAYAADVFHLATSKGVDMLISDIDDPKIADKIPAWYRQRMPARTFALFPLNIKGVPVALIYCDKDRAGSIVIPEKALQLLKTLRNQALLAIKQAA